MITEVNHSGNTRYELSLNTDLPVIVKPGDSYVIEVDYTGSNANHVAEIEVVHTDKNGSTVIDLTNGDVLLPDPWETTDIGNVNVEGSASENNGVFTIKGSGGDIWGSADRFRFMYQTLDGDGEMYARINSLTNTHLWSKAGVMIRETLDDGSKYAMTLMRPDRLLAFHRRINSNSSTQNTNKSNSTLPIWVKISRLDNSFTSYQSSDGITWTQIGNAVTINMGSTVYVGTA